MGGQPTHLPPWLGRDFSYLYFPFPQTCPPSVSPPPRGTTPDTGPDVCHRTARPRAQEDKFHYPSSFPVLQRSSKPVLSRHWLLRGTSVQTGVCRTERMLSLQVRGGELVFERATNRVQPYLCTSLCEGHGSAYSSVFPQTP